MPVKHRQVHDGIANDLGLSTRRLQDLISIGPAALRDFDLLGIHSVKQLARQNPTAPLPKTLSRHRTAHGHLLPGRLLCRYSPGTQSTSAR
jgi:hypothetical protein